MRALDAPQDRADDSSIPVAHASPHLRAYTGVGFTRIKISLIMGITIAIVYLGPRSGAGPGRSFQLAAHRLLIVRGSTQWYNRGTGTAMFIRALALALALVTIFPSGVSASVDENAVRR